MHKATRYPVPAGEASFQFEEKRSLFIGTAGPAPTVEEALAFIRSVAIRYADATHHAWAYAVGFGPGATTACHNDSEPGGTAGPPALAAIQSSGLGDVAVVVTRYFGGIKLGTGGLARAYGRAAREAIAALPRAEKVAKVKMDVTVDYHWHERCRHLFMTCNAEVVNTNYGAEVIFHLHVPLDMRDTFVMRLAEATAGQAKVQFAE